MKRILSIAFILAITVASPIFAQNPANQLPATQFLNGKSANYQSVNDCYVPFPPGTTPTQIITVGAGQTLSWCYWDSGVNAVKISWTLRVDSLPSVSLPTSCAQLNSPTICTALIPSNSITALQSKTSHMLVLNGTDGTNAVIPISLIIDRPKCSYGGKTYEVGDPLTADIPGALRNQQGSLTFETLVGNLRRAGFRAEWQRIQFRESSTALDGYWYLLGWCEGL